MEEAEDLERAAEWRMRKVDARSIRCRSDLDRPQMAKRPAPRTDGAQRGLQRSAVWDGRAEDLKAQARGPVQASAEMNSTGEFVEATLKSMPGYVEMFRKAFPNEPNPVTFDNFARAIEAFEATLITPGVRRGREAGCRHPAPRRQGALRNQQDGRG